MKREIMFVFFSKRDKLQCSKKSQDKVPAYDSVKLASLVDNNNWNVSVELAGGSVGGVS